MQWYASGRARNICHFSSGKSEGTAFAFLPVVEVEVARAVVGVPEEDAEVVEVHLLLFACTTGLFPICFSHVHVVLDRNLTGQGKLVAEELK